MVTLQDCDMSKRTIHNNIQTLKKNQRDFADTSFDPSKQNSFSVWLVNADDGVYWLHKSCFCFNSVFPVGTHGLKSTPS